MNIEQIEALLNRDKTEPNPYREFAVLIPLIDGPEGLEVVFERRAESLRSQPGEVCFPGGKCESGESPLSCAIRETCEEILVSPAAIQILGSIPPLITPFSYKLYPFVAYLKSYDPSTHALNRDEVDALLTVPLRFFLENAPETHLLESQVLPSEAFPYHKIQKGEAYPWKTASFEVLFYEYKDQIIWGLTAKMLRQFIETLR